MDFGLGLVLSFTDNATAGINNTVNSLSRLTQIAEDASTSMSQMASLSALSVVASQVGNSFTTAGQTILSTLGQVISKVNETGQTLMYAEKQLNLLYASDGENAGTAKLAEIQEYAKNSIFEFENLISVVTQLKTVGIEAFDTIASSAGNAYDVMTLASDLAAFNPNMRNVYGTGIEASMGALKEYIAEGNALSLKRGAGLDITAILGEEKGSTMEERARQVADLIEQLGMVGMTAELANSPMTKLSNMSDTLFQFLGMVSNSGVYDQFNALISKFADYVMAIPEEELASIAQTVGSALTSILKPLEKGIDKILSFVDGVRALVANNPKLLKFATIGVAIAGVLFVVTGVVLKATSALSGLSLMFLASGKSFSSMGGLIRTGIKKIASTLLPLIALLGMFYLAWKSDFAGIRTMTTSFVKNVISSFSTAKSAVNDSVEGMLITLDDLQRKGDFFSNFTISLMKVMQVVKSIAEAWNDNTLSEDNYQKAKELGVLPLIESLLDLKYRFGFFKQGFIDGWKEIGDKVQTFITGFADKLDGTVFQGIIDSVADLLQKLSSGDTQAWYGFGQSFADFTANAIVFWGILKTIGTVAKILTPIVTFLEAIKRLGALTGLSNLGGKIGGVATGIKNIVTVLKGGQGVTGLTKFIEALKAVDSFKGGKNVMNLSNALKTVFGTVGTVVAGITTLITGIVMAVTGFVKQLVDGFSWFWEIIKWIGIALGVVGAIILGASALPAVIVGAIVGAVTTLIVVIKDHWKQISAFLSTLGAWIYDNVIKPVADFFVNLWNGIVSVAVTAFNAVMNFFKGIPAWFSTNVIQPVLSFFSKLWSGLVAGVMKAVSAVKNFFSTIAGWIFNTVIQPVVNFFMTYIYPFIEKIVEIVAKIIEIVVTLVRVGINFLVQKVKEFVQAVVSTVQSIVSWINTNIIQPIATFFTWLWNIIVTGVQNLVSSIKNWFSSAVNWINTNVIQPVVGFFTWLWSTIVTGVTQFVADAKAVIGVITSWINDNIISPVATFFSEMWTGIVTGITNFIESAKAIFITIVDWVKTNIIDPLATFFSGLWEGVQVAFNFVVDGITSVLKSAINGVLNTIGNIINGVIWGINKAIDVINAIPGVSITKITELDIPQLAKGGVVDKPTVSMIGERGKEAVVPLENNTEWTGEVASLLSNALRNRANEMGNYSAVTSVLNSCASVMAKMMSVVSSISGSDFEPVKTPVNTQNTPSTSNGSTQSYMTSNNNNSTYQGDTDNSITFEAGSIVIHANGASDAEAMRMAKKIMELIKRQKELDDMLAYN